MFSPVQNEVFTIVLQITERIMTVEAVYGYFQD